LPFILDTNVAIHVRDHDPAVRARLADLGDTVSISIVTRVELEGGAAGDQRQGDVRRARLDLLLAAMPVIPFDDAAADAYRAILQVTGYSRRKVLDRMIAAQALVHHATLVTLNPNDFRDVPGLSLLAW
jgi:predicted nucleic acid-binding protein